MKKVKVSRVNIFSLQHQHGSFLDNSYKIKRKKLWRIIGAKISHLCNKMEGKNRQKMRELDEVNRSSSIVQLYKRMAPIKNPSLLRCWTWLYWEGPAVEASRPFMQGGEEIWWPQSTSLNWLEAGFSVVVVLHASLVVAGLKEWLLITCFGSNTLRILRWLLLPPTMIRQEN